MYNADVQDLDKLNKVPREDHVWPRPKQDCSRKRCNTDVSDCELMEAILKSEPPNDQLQNHLELFAKSVAETMRHLAKGNRHG